MKGSIMALSLAGFLASLAGCNKAPVAEDVRHLENPPPKPPNCPDLPELKNITLKDGTVADVRIVQFGETKLYIPKDILSNDIFVPEDYRVFNKHGPIQKSKIGRLQPFVIENECPGVVHKHSGNIYGRSSGIFISTEEVKKNIGLQNPLIEQENIVELKNILLWSKFENTNEDISILSSGRYPYASITYNNKFSVMFEWNAKEPLISDRDLRLKTKEFELWKQGVLQSRAWSDSKKVIFDFIDWLATPPINRDNNRRFELRGKGL